MNNKIIIILLLSLFLVSIFIWGIVLNDNRDICSRNNIESRVFSLSKVYTPVERENIIQIAIKNCRGN